jgi:hypothetical protein
MRQAMWNAGLIGAVLAVSGCGARQPVRMAPAVAVTTHADSVRIAATIVTALLADSALYAEVRQAMTAPGRPPAEHPRVDSLLYDSVRETLARLRREATARTGTDASLDGDLLRLKARLDSLLLDAAKNPRKYTNLRIF